MRQILAFLAITLLPGFAQASVVVTSEISHPLVRSSGPSMVPVTATKVHAQQQEHPSKSIPGSSFTMAA